MSRIRAQCVSRVRSVCEQDRAQSVSRIGAQCVSRVRSVCEQDQAAVCNRVRVPSVSRISEFSWIGIHTNSRIVCFHRILERIKMCSWKCLCWDPKLFSEQ